MTLPAPPPTPKSPIAQFGIAIVGEPFEWASVNLGEVEIHTFRGNAEFTFDDQLNYQAIASQLQANVWLKARAANERIGLLENDKLTTEELTEILDKYRDEVVEREREEWEKLVTQILILVSPPDRDALHPLLSKGNPKAVKALRQHLEEKVMGKVHAEVEAVANVDPTLPEQQSGPSDIPESGDDSDSTESPSTD